MLFSEFTSPWAFFLSTNFNEIWDSIPFKHGNQEDVPDDGNKKDEGNGSFGPNGIFRLKDFKDSGGTNHDNVGVHAGRKDKGVNAKTEGCIRTTDEAMGQIVKTAKDDPLKTLKVENDNEPKKKDTSQQQQQKQQQ